MNNPDKMTPEEFQEALANRQAARRMIEENDNYTDPIIAGLKDIEGIASSFYFGFDYNDLLPDEDDIRPY